MSSYSLHEVIAGLTERIDNDRFDACGDQLLQAAVHFLEELASAPDQEELEIQILHLKAEIYDLQQELNDLD
jgi:hypothetical protein